MQTEDLIAAEAFCAGHQIELSFIRTLHASGLIDMTIQEGTVYVPADELSALERFVRWHYDLAINPEGIEALAHLLFRVGDLQEEVRALRNKLQRYEPSGRGAPSDL
ncbi:MAG TPA: chaperone modulator CbpM [Puia sp.]|nr:chaperone modulator CbpM [Puia sp.]